MIETCEKWRRDFKVDELYETFDYKEKEAVNNIYPQFYHKVDKVRCCSLLLCFRCQPAHDSSLGWSPCVH